MWKEALQLSVAESSQASLERNHGDALSSSSLCEVDIKAAARACRNSEIPRRCASLPCLLGAGAQAHQHTLLMGVRAMLCGSHCTGAMGEQGQTGEQGRGGTRFPVSRHPVGTRASLEHCMIL